MVIDLPGITLRPAQDADLNQVVSLERLCFAPTQSDADIQQAWFSQGLNRPGRQQMLALDAASGEAIGTYAQLDLQIFLEGQDLPAKGIAGLAVAPHRRGQRVARFLIEQSLKAFQAAGQQGNESPVPLVMLYPFRHAFYRRLGWAWVGRVHQYAVAPESIPAYPERHNVVPYQAETHEQALYDTYLRSASRHNGWLRRQVLQWEMRLRPEPGKVIYCYEEAGKLLGYVILQFGQTGDRCTTVSILEWVAVNVDAYRGILGFLSSLRDQVSTIFWNTYPEDPFPHLLEEQRQAHTHAPLFSIVPPFGQIGGGFMWRLVDLAAAFRLRPVHAGPPFILTFQVRDPILGNQTITANFTAGRMHPVSQPVPAVVTTSIEHLTEMFCGMRRPTELLWTREIEFEGDRALLQRLEAAWQCIPPFCWDVF